MNNLQCELAERETDQLCRLSTRRGLQMQSGRRRAPQNSHDEPSHCEVAPAAVEHPVCKFEVLAAGIYIPGARVGGVRLCSPNVSNCQL